MYKSILQFCQEGTQNLENCSADFFTNPKDMAGFIRNVGREILKLGCEFIGEVFCELDQAIRNHEMRKSTWEVVRRDTKSMLCHLGEFSYEKTMYKNKETGERTYLLDRYLELDSHERLTEDAKASMLEEAVESSYRKAGERTSLSESVSKGTVMNLLHSLEFPKESYSEEKRQVRYLYIDADEDHVPLQYLKAKGELKAASNGNKYNNVPVKLVYVYEGIEPETPGGKRYRLIHSYYFSGVYAGKQNEELWEDIAEYIQNTYEMDAIDKIYLNSDGGSWIKQGKNKIAGIVSVMDEYHINKYITAMTTHLRDSAEDGRNLLRQIIRTKTKTDFQDAVDKLLEHAETEAERTRINTGAKYILSNWTACKIRFFHKLGVLGSSTEAHVSHVLASRMIKADGMESGRSRQDGEAKSVFLE